MDPDDRDDELVRGLAHDEADLDLGTDFEGVEVGAAADEWFTLRLRIPVAARDVVLRALRHASREVHASSLAARLGLGLEYIAADFLAGVETDDSEGP